MSKTPEQMAEEYVEAEFKGNGGNVSRAVCKYDFMSGYRAAIDLIHRSTTKEMSDLAHTFAANYFGKEYAVSFDSFLAGYQAGRLNSEGVQAAKDQLADADKVMCNTTMEEIKAIDTGEIIPITNLPTPAKWISVKERLPKIPDTRSMSEDVLWLTRYGEMEVSCLERLRSEFRVDWGDAGLLKLDQFTHWMPLPEPPKEEK